MNKIIWILLLLILSAIFFAFASVTERANANEPEFEYEVKHYKDHDNIIRQWIVTDVNRPCYRFTQQVIDKRGVKFLQEVNERHPVSKIIVTAYIFGKDRLPNGGWRHVEGWYAEPGEDFACLTLLSIYEPKGLKPLGKAI